MSKKGMPIDPNTKCPWCGAVYPDIRLNGFYVRDKNKIRQYFCKKCKRGFSSSIIKNKILKPLCEIEVGYRVKIEVKVETGRNLGIKEIKFNILKEEQVIASGKLENQKDDQYKGIWDATEVSLGRYILEVTATDIQENISVQSKVIEAVQHYDILIQKIAAESEIDPYLIKAIIFCESSFRADKGSEKGALGLMQLMPKTATSLGVTDRKNPKENIWGGTKYLKDLLGKLKNINLALAAYNFGIGNILANKLWPQETKQYVPRVLKYWKKFSEEAKEYYVID